LPDRAAPLARIPGSAAKPRALATRTAATDARTGRIAVYSVKGGVGKTTLAANLAWCSARIAGKRTLLWDLDAAAGAGFLLGIEPSFAKPAEGVFSRARRPEKLIRKTAHENLDVLPADESIRALDAQFIHIGKRNRLARLADELSSSYERIVFDCPPVMNEISAQVVRAADLIIVPLPPSPLSSRAFALVAGEVAANSGKRHPPILPVLSMLDMRRSLHREAREANPDWPAIPYASTVEQGAVRQKPVGAFAPASPAALAFERLWAAIEQKLASLAS
jgi:chromosome partitioning protein